MVSDGHPTGRVTVTLITVALRVSPLASGGEVGALSGLELLLSSSLAPPFLPLKLLLSRVGMMCTMLQGAAGGWGKVIRSFSLNNKMSRQALVRDQATKLENPDRHQQHQWVGDGAVPHGEGSANSSTMPKSMVWSTTF